MERNGSGSCANTNKVKLNNLPLVVDNDIESSKYTLKIDNSDSTLNSTNKKSNAVERKTYDTTRLNSSETMDKIIKIVASSINEIISINSRITGSSVSDEDSVVETRDAVNSPFYSKRIPNITIEAYLHRIVKYTKMEASSLILTSIYVDRFCEKYEYFLSPHTAFR